MPSDPRAHVDITADERPLAGSVHAAMLLSIADAIEVRFPDAAAHLRGTADTLVEDAQMTETPAAMYYVVDGRHVRVTPIDSQGRAVAHPTALPGPVRVEVWS